MSYNIDAWKTKKLENLEIPVKEFFTHKRDDFHPEMTKEGEQTTLSDGENEIVGIEKDGILHITSIAVCGEFSGTFYEDILKPALTKSTGKLKAITIWEGGDSVMKLSVKNGEIKESQVDL